MGVCCAACLRGIWGLGGSLAFKSRCREAGPLSEVEGGEVERIQRRDLAQADADLAAHPSESILTTSFPPPPKAQRAAEGREPGHCRGPKPWGDSVWPSYSTLYTHFCIKKH